MLQVINWHGLRRPLSMWQDVRIKFKMFRDPTELCSRTVALFRRAQAAGGGTSDRKRGCSSLFRANCKSLARQRPCCSCHVVTGPTGVSSRCRPRPPLYAFLDSTVTYSTQYADHLVSCFRIVSISLKTWLLRFVQHDPPFQRF